MNVHVHYSAQVAERDDATLALLSFQKNIVVRGQSKQNYRLCFEGQLNASEGSRECRSVTN